MAASISLPVDTFVEAVRLAICVPFSEGAECGVGRGPGNCERHPAMRFLADAWNTAAPDDLCSAAFAICFVKQDGEYRCAASDVLAPSLPDRDVPASCAQVGDDILLQFVRSFAAGRRNGHGWEFLQVDGALWLDVAVADDERDEAYWGLVALEAFPRVFPSVWACIVQQSAGKQYMEHHHDGRRV